MNLLGRPASPLPSPAPVPSPAPLPSPASRTLRTRREVLGAGVRRPAAGATAEPPGVLVDALDDLAHRIADVEQAWAARTALRDVVQRLEVAAGLIDRSPDPDPVVVLQRRFAHAHRLLLEDPRGLTGADVADLHRALAPQD